MIWPLSQLTVLSIPSTFQQKALSASGSSSSVRSAEKVAALADAGVPMHPAAPALPYALGFVGAVPLTLLQRRLRQAIRRRSGR